MATRTLYPSIAPSLDLNFAGSKTLDPRITFSRASAATYYDGKTVAKAEENLLLRSQEFENASWTKVGSSVLANAGVAPDGSGTAAKLLETASTSAHSVSQNTNVALNQQYTFSVYLKAAERNWAIVWFDGDTAGVYIDLSTGTLGNIVGGATAAIVDAKNGWWRASITKTLTGSGVVRIYAATGNLISNYTGDGTSGIYIWGAQLEQRSQVTAYTPTTTQPITNYIPVLQTALAGVPRFDHNPVTGESLGLLVEEQRTNLLLRSQDFSYAVWQGTGSALALAGIAPDGTLSSYKLSEDTSSAVHYKYQGLAGTLGATVYTLSAYVKAAGRSRVQLWSASGTPRFSARFDLAAKTAVTLANVGTASVISSSITEVGNDWYRISVTGTTGTDNVLGINIFLDNGSNHSYQGDGYSGVYIWGVQVEAGAFPTSYIKTEASQVTRAADSASMTGANFSSWYRQDEGTLFADYAVRGLSSANQFSACGANAGSGTASVFGINAQNTASQHRGLVIDNAAVLSASISQTSANITKAAFAIAANSFKFSVAGQPPSVDTAGNTPTVDRLTIGSVTSVLTAGGAGTIKRIAYYPKRLTEAQLQAMTL